MKKSGERGVNVQVLFFWQGPGKCVEVFSM